MRVRRLIPVVLAAVILALALGGSALAEEKVYNIKFSLHIPPKVEVPSYASTLYFQSLVESQSKGRVKVQIFPSNQLGSERESLEGLKLGTHQMDLTSSGAVPAFFPEIQCLALPYLFESRAVAWKVFDGWFGQELSEAMAQKAGMRILGYCENGIRHFVTTKKQINSPDDLKGLKIRTMENPAHMRLVKALGASPTPIAWGELYTAVQQGVVDGYELPLPLIEFVKLFQVSKHVVLDGHIYDPAFIWINEKFFQSLPKDLRVMVKNAVIEANVIERGQQAYWTEVPAAENLKKEGMVLTSPSPEARKAFREITQPAVAEFIKEKIGTEWPDKLQKAIAEAEAELNK